MPLVIWHLHVIRSVLITMLYALKLCSAVAWGVISCAQLQVVVRCGETRARDQGCCNNNASAPVDIAVRCCCGRALATTVNLNYRAYYRYVAPSKKQLNMTSALQQHCFDAMLRYCHMQPHCGPAATYAAGCAIYNNATANDISPGAVAVTAVINLCCVARPRVISKRPIDKITMHYTARMPIKQNSLNWGANKLLLR